MGGFQLEGHQAALPAQVSGQRGMGHIGPPSLWGHPRCPTPTELPPHSLCLRTTVLAAVAFLDAFQKVADMATNTRGRGLSLRGGHPQACLGGGTGGECPLWGVPCPPFWGRLQAAASPSTERCPAFSHIMVHGAFPGKQHWKNGVGRGKEVGTHVGAAPHHP